MLQIPIQGPDEGEIPPLAYDGPRKPWKEMKGEGVRTPEPDWGEVRTIPQQYSFIHCTLMIFNLYPFVPRPDTAT
jgi:hypothetical protein